MPKRSSNQELDEVGEAQLVTQLRPYPVEGYEKDYGLDFIVNLTDDDTDDRNQQNIRSDHFFIQLKSTAKFDADAEAVYEDIEIEHLKQYMGQPIPVVLAIYDDNSGEIYWRIIQEYIWDHLSNKKPDWRSQETHRITIPRSRLITDHDRLENAVNRTQNRIDRRRQRALNIGEGVAFTPDDFSELEHHAEQERLSYRGHKLLIAQQYLKRGKEDEAKESIDEILNADYDDEATVKALFAQIYMRNPAEGEEAVEIAEFAQEARELAAGLDMEVDQRIAHIFQHVAGLFIFAEKRQEMLVTDRIQSLDEFNVPEYEYLRNELSSELFLDELMTVNALNEELAALLENEQYYAYAVALPEIIDYLTKRRSIQLLSENDPESVRTSTANEDSEKDESSSEDGDREELKKRGAGDTHPLVAQAEQLVDFVTESELEANLRKSVGTYYYYDRDPDTASEYLKEARDLAVESGDTALEEALNNQLDHIEEVDDPYDTAQYDNDEERGPQEAAKTILEMQGIEIDLDDPPDPYEADPMVSMGYHAIRDADPEPQYRHCEHLHLAYSPSYAGKVLGMVSFGQKYLWCQHGGFMHGISLTDMFDKFNKDYCDGCEHHCPHSDGWELTDEYAEQQVNDPDFQAVINRFESSIPGNIPESPD